MVGGFKDVDVSPAGLAASEDAADIKAAADAVVAELSTSTPTRLIAIKSAAKQVVAGLNWKLTLDVAQGGTTKTVGATVFQPLGGAALQVTALD